MKHDFRTVQGCPVGKNLAPYIAISINDAHATVNSIYRGFDSEPILNRHGHLSQAQLYAAWVAWRDHGILIHGFTRSNPPNPANPPGFSTHEQKSDGVAYPHIPRGHDLSWWQVGFDVNDWQVGAVIAAARKHHWQVFQPYRSGSEFHHLNFRVEPKAHSRKDDIRIKRLRLTLPRR